MKISEAKYQVLDKWFTIMVNETTELSNTEQMVFGLRHVDINMMYMNK